jgi:hypothetical protein
MDAGRGYGDGRNGRRGETMKNLSVMLKIKNNSSFS